MKNAPTTGGVHNSGDNIDIKTVDSLQQNIEDLTNEGSTESVYVEIPKVNLKNIIIDNKEIYEKCDEWWTFDEEEAEEFHKLYGYYNRRDVTLLIWMQIMRSLNHLQRKKLTILSKSLNVKSLLMLMLVHQCLKQVY